VVAAAATANRLPQPAQQAAVIQPTLSHSTASGQHSGPTVSAQNHSNGVLTAPTAASSLYAQLVKQASHANTAARDGASSQEIARSDG
jgi:hypothetical protein